jgi:neutral ceramidase
MAGRRWKEAIAAAATSKAIVPGGTTPKVVLGGPGNTYAHYVTTREEYGIQRYEGGSTLYGPSHLDAFIYLATSNIGYLKAGATPQIAPGPSPPNNSGKSPSFISPVVHDQPPVGRKFGQVITQPQASYTIGSVVKTSFTGANPRNNFRLEGTFAAVEQRQADGTWKQVRDDFDWALVYTWVREDGFWGTSRAEINWETESWTQKGTYRIKYYGDSKTPFTGRIVAFEGTSNEFTIV